MTGLGHKPPSLARTATMPMMLVCATASATNFNTMSKHKTSKLSDHDVIAMLKRYNCPVPFHTVRTLFLGSIASPSFNISPIQVVQSL